MMTLEQLIEALNCSRTARCRDEAGDLRIVGRSGHIYAQPEGFYIYCEAGSPRAWTFAKRELSFCKVTQDGDEEGFLLLDHVPSLEEAIAITSRLGIRKRKHISEKERERLARTGFRSKPPPAASGSTD